VTQYHKYSDELPTIEEIRQWVSGYPDEDQLIAIISRSYDYIRRLPLEGIVEDYCRNDECSLE
jgi:hypothetical protein